MSKTQSHGRNRHNELSKHYREIGIKAVTAAVKPGSKDSDERSKWKEQRKDEPTEVSSCACVRNFRCSVAFYEEPDDESD
jgi:hypothetical protein